MSKKITNWTEATSVAGYTFGFVRYICGECFAPSKAKRREMVPITNQNNVLAHYCAHCHTWNILGLYWA